MAQSTMMRTRRIATRSLLLSALVSVVLVGAGTIVTIAPTTGAAYSVRQLDREIRLHPRAWVGHTISVRAVGLRYFWGSGYRVVAGQQALLIDPPFPGVFSSTAYGSRAVHLNGAGVAASVLIAGSLPQPSSGRRLLIMLAHAPVIGRLFGTSPESAPDNYRIRIVRAGPCPTPFSGFCPTGITVP